MKRTAIIISSAILVAACSTGKGAMTSSNEPQSTGNAVLVDHKLIGQYMPGKVFMEVDYDGKKLVPHEPGTPIRPIPVVPTVIPGLGLCYF